MGPENHRTSRRAPRGPIPYRKHEITPNQTCLEHPRRPATDINHRRERCTSGRVIRCNRRFPDASAPVASAMWPVGRDDQLHRPAGGATSISTRQTSSRLPPGMSLEAPRHPSRPPSIYAHRESAGVGGKTSETSQTWQTWQTWCTPSRSQPD